jgi:hypothetical protein
MVSKYRIASFNWRSVSPNFSGLASTKLWARLVCRNSIQPRGTAFPFGLECSSKRAAIQELKGLGNLLAVGLRLLEGELANGRTAMLAGALFMAT